MLIVAKSALYLANCLVVCKSVCAIFKTFDVLMHVKLSVVKLEAENRLAVHNFETVIYQMDKIMLNDDARQW